MDMNVTSSTSNSTVSSAAVLMMPFHTGIGMDVLWFQPWIPTEVSSTFGACVGLFFLAAFYRFLNAVKVTTDLKWHTEWAEKMASLSDNCCEPSPGVLRFSLKPDLLRGLLEGLFSFIGYFLMLAVMVMNAWFFIAIILGITVGETLFGRFAARGIEKGRSC